MPSVVCDWTGTGVSRNRLLLVARPCGRDPAEPYCSRALRGIAERWRGLSRGDWLHVAALALIVVVGAAIRLAYLNEPMRYDEAYSFLHYARLPLSAIVRTYDTANNHILSNLLVHFSYYHLGGDRWMLRLPALLAGVAAPLAGYWAAREMFDRDAGLWTAALVATSEPLVDFSVNARGYTLAILFLLLALALGVRVVRTQSLWAVGGFAVCAVLAAWAVPTAAYGLAVVGAWMVAAVVIRPTRDWRAIGRVVATLALPALVGYLLYRPLMHQYGWKQVTPIHIGGPEVHINRGGRIAGAGDPVWNLAKATWANWWRATPHPIDWLIPAAAVASAFVARRRPGEWMPLILAWALTLALLIVVLPVSPFRRSWLALLPLLLVAAGAGLAAGARIAAERLPRARLAGTIAALVLTGGLAVAVLNAGQARSEEPPQSDNKLVSVLRQILRPGERVLYDEPAFGAQLDYYLGRAHYPVEEYRVPPADERDGRVVVIVTRDRPWDAVLVVKRLGGHPTGRFPRELRRLPYISIYAVQVKRPRR